MCGWRLGVGVLIDAGWWVTAGQRCVIDDPATVAVGPRVCVMVCVWVWGWGEYVGVCVGMYLLGS